MILKPNFYVLKIKRNILSLIFICFTLCLLAFSSTNLPAIKDGLILWATSVVPALFPFFVATELLIHTNIITILGNYLNKFMQPIFNVNGKGSFAFIMGIISGYPIGAKIASDFRKNNICSKEECERLLSFTNNSGPLFIIGTVGILMYRNTTIGVLLFITHILSCITVGILFRFWKNNKSEKNPKISKNIRHNNTINTKNTKLINPTFSNLGEILSQSITSSISTILLIGGFIIIFSSIISILNTTGTFNLISNILSPLFNLIYLDFSYITPILSGILEITTGINQISIITNKKLSINIIFTAFLLGFGGVSILLQVLSIISKTDLSIKPYIYGKILQGFIASFYTYIFINIFPFFNFNL